MNKNFSCWVCYLLLVFMLFFLATANEIICALGDESPKNTYIFGFDLRNNLLEDSKQYTPFLEYLSKSTGYNFELKLTSENDSIADLLGTGKIQFASIGADTYLQAHAKYGVLTLVRGVNQRGKSEYQSLIVVSPTSSISNIKQLRGKRIAFGSITSTQGRLIPLIMFAKEGLSITDFESHKFTGSHRNCAQAVVRGESDACGMQDALGKEFADAGLVKILAISDFYPSSGIAANQNVPIEVVNRTKKALLNFEPNGAHKEGLYHWEKTEMPNGFSESKDSDYAELLLWSKELGLQ